MEVSRSATLRANERIKHGATAMTAWGNALIIAGFGKMGFEQKFDWYAASWIAGAIWLKWMASMALTMLQAEGEI